MAKWLELLRTGNFKDRHGVNRTITQDTINTIASNYEEGVTNAPVLVGHPDPRKLTIPSFGVFSALRAVGDKLFGLPGEIVPEFSKLVRKGAFPDLSVGLNKAMDKLTHVAFLSAEKPAIDGLAPVCELSAEPFDDTIVSVDVTDIVKNALPEFASAAENVLRWRIADIAAILRNVKNYLIEKETQEKADALVPEWLLDGLSNDLPDETETPAFSASEKAALESAVAAKELVLIDLRGKLDPLELKCAEFSASVTQLTADLNSQQEQNLALQKKVINYEKELRGAEFSAFVDNLGDRILPDQRESIVALLETMHQATPAEFSADSGQVSPLEAYKKELRSRPVIVKTGEKTPPEFSAHHDDDPVAKGMRARAYIDEQKAKGVTVDIYSALKLV